MIPIFRTNEIRHFYAQRDAPETAIFTFNQFDEAEPHGYITRTRKIHTSQYITLSMYPPDIPIANLNIKAFDIHDTDHPLSNNVHHGGRENISSNEISC